MGCAAASSSGWIAFGPTGNNVLAEGCHNAVQLWREIQEQGYCGRPGIIRQWASRLRGKGLAARSPEIVPSTGKPVPTPLQVAWWLLRSEERKAEEHRFPAAPCEHAPEVKKAAEAACQFTRLVRERDAQAWPVGQKAAADTLLARFVRQLQRDEAAV